MPPASPFVKGRQHFCNDAKVRWQIVGDGFSVPLQEIATLVGEAFCLPFGPDLHKRGTEDPSPTQVSQ